MSDVGVEFIKVGLVAMKFPEDGADFCLHRINFIVVEVNLGAEFINIGAPDARITDGVIKLDRDRAEISGVFAKITPRHGRPT